MSSISIPRFEPVRRWQRWRMQARRLVFAPMGVMGVLGAVAAMGLVASTALGTVSLSLDQIYAGIVAYGFHGETLSGSAGPIVWDLRLPRALLGALVGMNLAVAGTLLQGVMRNPLAAPNIVGVTAGAGLAATVVLVAFPGILTLSYLATLTLPAVAFFGAMVAACFVYSVSWQPGYGTSPMRMVLAGVAITAMLGAVQTFLMVHFSDRVQSVVLWQAGSLNTRGWQQLRIVLPFTGIGLILAGLVVRPLNALQLGEEAARSLGVRVERSRVVAFVAAALLAASAISVAGLIAFVGLVVPHIMRMMVGYRHGVLVAASAIGGAALMVWADLSARLLNELPVGVLTALIGGPYFLFLLYARRFS